MSSRVYVGNLGDQASKRELEREFERFGPLRDVWVARNPPGFAFVVFEDTRDAKDAVEDLDGQTICGTKVRVELARGPTRGGRAARLGLTEKCYECGRVGHFARNCTRRPGSPSRRRGRSRSRSRSPPRRRERSRSLERRDRRTPSRSRSHSPVKDRRSYNRDSRSPSPIQDRSSNVKGQQGNDNLRDGRDNRRRERSRSFERRDRRTPSRSRSRSHSPEKERRIYNRERSPSPNQDRNGNMKGQQENDLRDTRDNRSRSVSPNA